MPGPCAVGGLVEVDGSLVAAHTLRHWSVLVKMVICNQVILGDLRGQLLEILRVHYRKTNRFSG